MINIEGKVSSGLKKAGSFMKKDVYVKQYEQKLGFKPFYGTLNVKLEKALNKDMEIIKENFQTLDGNDKFAHVFFIMARIINPKNNLKEDGAILFPSASIYSYDTLEFIAANKLRDSLKLDDEDNVLIEIEL